MPRNWIKGGCLVLNSIYTLLLTSILSGMFTMLSPKQLDQFKTDGYTVIENVLSPEHLAQMKTRAASIVNDWKDDTDNPIFTTQDNDRSNNSYFLNSAENISCFYEEEAFDANGEFVQKREDCINKIGHALHELDPTFQTISHLPLLGDIAKDLGLEQPELRQSMYIFKQPRIGGVVNWHQDATFFYSNPISVITFWFAIEDATLENGCLWVEPKGHLSPLRERFNRDDNITTMDALDDTPWPTESGVPLEVKAGTLVCFHGKLPHYSAPNRSDKSRQAYTLHVTDGRCHYAESNWLQTKTLPLRGFDIID